MLGIGGPYVELPVRVFQRVEIVVFRNRLTNNYNCILNFLRSYAIKD